MTFVEERTQIRQAVFALEICWRCQRVSECIRYLLGNSVLAWLCQKCYRAME